MKRILLMVAALSLAACGGGSTETTADAADETSGSEQAGLTPIGETQVGDRTTCPVSGEEFVVTESSPTVEHAGRTYHFCCPGCAQRFEADPERFLREHADRHGHHHGHHGHRGHHGGGHHGHHGGGHHGHHGPDAEEAPAS